MLKPLEDITKKLSSQNTCISYVIPLVRALNKIYDEDEIQENLNISVSAVLNFVSALKNELDYRFSEIDKNVLFQIAIFLDPRYKGKFFCDILIKDIKEKLLTAIETEENLIVVISTKVKPITVRKGQYQNLEESIANMLDSDDDDEQSENQLSDTKANLILEYMSEKRLPRDQDQFKYWQINSKKLPNI